MKRIIVILFSLMSIFTTNIYGQCGCTEYNYSLTTVGFSCEYQSGEICVSAIADDTAPPIICADYEVEIEYPKGNFIFTDLRDFQVYYEDQNIVKLRAHIQLSWDYRDYVCLSGLLQEPETNFILRIINPETGCVVNGPDLNGDGINDGEPFQIEESVEIGTDGVDIYLSQAINIGLLLPLNQAYQAAQNVRIHGNLIIDEDYHIDNGSTIIMEQNSSIKVLPSNILNIVESKIFNCEDKYWKGIIVENGAEIYLWKSIIKNAVNAVELMNNSFCNVSASHFDKNKTAIACLGDSHKDITLQVVSHPFIGQSSFSNGDYGIKLVNTNEFITNSFHSFSNLNTAIDIDRTDLISWYNFFNNCTYGINANKSPNHVNINHCEFIDVKFGVKVEGTPSCNILNQNYFENGDWAIIRNSVGVDELTNIEDNYIIGYNIGISGRLKQSRGNIMNNTIHTKMYNARLFGLEGKQTWAIQYNKELANQYAGSQFANVSFNNITDGRIFNNSSIGSGGNGIKIEGGTFNNVGYNDMIGDSKTGITLKNSDLSSLYCNDVNYTNGIQILSNNSGSDIRGNHTEHNDLMGLLYGTPTQTYANTGTQAYKGNTFANSSLQNPKAVNYSTSVVAKQNQYILGNIAGNQGTKYYPYFIANIDNWFDKDPIQRISDYVCSDGNTGTTSILDKDKLCVVIQEDTSLVRKIRNDYGYGGILDDAKVKTVEHILDYWDMGGTMFTDVMQHPDFLEAVQLATLKHQLNEVLTTEIFNEEEINNWENEMRQIITLLSTYSKYTFDPVADTIVMHTKEPAYLNLLYRLDTTKARFSGERLAKQTYVDEQVTQLLSQIDGMPRNGSVYSGYYLDMMGLCMKMQLSGFNGFTQIQKNMINTVSEQCLYLYADPVSLARSLRTSYDTDLVEYADDCRDNLPIDLRSDLKDLEIYPNPASLSINIALTESEEAVFEILNSLGLVIDVVKVDRNITISVSDYTPGIYFLRDKAGVFEIRKFSIVK